MSGRRTGSLGGHGADPDEFLTKNEPKYSSSRSSLLSNIKRRSTRPPGLPSAGRAASSGQAALSLGALLRETCPIWDGRKLSLVHCGIQCIGRIPDSYAGAVVRVKSGVLRFLRGAGTAGGVTCGHWVEEA